MGIETFPIPKKTSQTKIEKLKLNKLQIHGRQIKFRLTKSIRTIQCSSDLLTQEKYLNIFSESFFLGIFIISLLMACYAFYLEVAGGNTEARKN